VRADVVQQAQARCDLLTSRLHGEDRGYRPEWHPRPMGTSWSWEVALSDESLTAHVVEHALACARQAGLTVHRPDGAINGFSRDGDHRIVGYRELVSGLANLSLATNLWAPSGRDVWLSTFPSFGVGPPRLRMNLDCIPRPPAPDAHDFRSLHRVLTGVWIELLDDLGAEFGRVDDEWSIEQVWDMIPKPVTFNPPPVDQWPFPLGWWTFVDAHRYLQLPPLPSWLPARIARTPGGGTVVALTDDPAMIDVLDYEDIHRRLQAGAH
jgi:hypothetical protein